MATYECSKLTCHLACPRACPDDRADRNRARKECLATPSLVPATAEGAGLGVAKVDVARDGRGGVGGDRIVHSRDDRLLLLLSLLPLLLLLLQLLLFIASRSCCCCCPCPCSQATTPCRWKRAVGGEEEVATPELVAAVASAGEEENDADGDEEPAPPLHIHPVAVGATATAAVVGAAVCTCRSGYRPRVCELERILERHCRVVGCCRSAVGG